MPYDSKARMAALDEAEDKAESALGGHLRARLKPKEIPAREMETEGEASEVAELKPLLEQLIALLGGESAPGAMPEGKMGDAPMPGA